VNFFFKTNRKNKDPGKYISCKKIPHRFDRSNLGCDHDGMNNPVREKFFYLAGKCFNETVVSFNFFEHYRGMRIDIDRSSRYPPGQIVRNLFSPHFFPGNLE
jgi:hypothetical protein